MTNSGTVYVFTGEGKGKTSAAIGVAVRSLLEEKVVSWIAFYKQESWGIAESKLKSKFERLDMQLVGKGFKIDSASAKQISKSVKIVKIANDQVVLDNASSREHFEAANLGLSLIKEKLVSQPFLLVMDEVLNAVGDGLIEEEQLLEIIENRGVTHLVLTGRGATQKVVEVADLVTECRKIKHPYDLGKLAIKGLDF